jgi:hypothetical protein
MIPENKAEKIKPWEWVLAIFVIGGLLLVSGVVLWRLI